MQQGSDTWQIDSRGPWGDLSTIRVSNNNTSEQYQNFARKNNRSVPAAKAEIIDEAGNVLASGRFEYG